MAAENKGRITQVIGAVLDIQFPAGTLPEINEAIRIEREEGGVLIVEVSQHLGDDTVDVYKRQNEIRPSAGSFCGGSILMEGTQWQNVRTTEPSGSPLP